MQSRGGEIGRRRGLKIPRSYDHAGSIPALGTEKIARNLSLEKKLRVFYLQYCVYFTA